MLSTPRMQLRVTLSFRWIGPAAFLLLGTVGCTVTHDAGSARAALPPRAVRLAEPPPVESGPSAPAPGAASMRLCIEDVAPLARTASERVLEAAARVHETEAQDDATLGEVFLPKIDAVGSYWRSDRQLEINTQFGPLPIASHNLGFEMVRVTQPLLDVADFFFRYGAERTATDVARLAAARAADVAELAAVRAFYEILSRREEIVALERSVQVLESHVTDARHLFAAGRAPENDVTKVDLELSRRPQALLAARHGEREATLELLAALALSPETSLTIEAPAAAPDAVPAPLPQLVARARLAVEEQQSALAVAQRSVAQAEASLRVEDDLYRHDKSAAAAVLDSELKLVESRVDAAHARYGTLAATAALKAATGGGSS